MRTDNGGCNGLNRIEWPPEAHEFECLLQGGMICEGLRGVTLLEVVCH